MKKARKVLVLLLACLLIVLAFAGCGKKDGGTVKPVDSHGKRPKYVFLFIGDGMSYPQIQLTNYYRSINNQRGAKSYSVDGQSRKALKSGNDLNMMQFQTAGSAQTYDRTSFAPDSASTATSIATGHKTWSGSINVSADFSRKYETIAEKLKKQKNYKIGVITSVNINHATPAAFYAHQKSRDSYYAIGKEMIASNFDYFTGGTLREPTGENGGQPDLYKLAEKAGYNVVRTQNGAEQLRPKDGKSIVVSKALADEDSMPYEIDRKDGTWSLADYVDKGIDMLDNKKGFFMVVEGGKIDWACHANDAASVLDDTLALDDAVGRAVKFYNKYPDETLIIVTGDHETGGLTIGFAGTNYDTFLNNMNSQKISYAKFDEDYVEKYKKNQTDFNTVMNDITRLFGLERPTNNKKAMIAKDSADKHPDPETGGSLVLTSYEYQELRDAYQMTLNRTGEETEYAQDEYIKYGSYEPLTVTITHILNNKNGVSFSSYSHTGLPTEVLVQGAGSFGLVTVAPFTAVMAGTILTRHGRSRDRDEQLRLPDGKDE